MVGHDLDRDATRTFRVARIRSDIRFATRRERDYRQPESFDVEEHRVARPWQIGPAVGTARIEVQGDTAWWVHRTFADAGRVVDGVFETSYATLGPLVSWILRQNGRAIRSSRPRCGTRWRTPCVPCASAIPGPRSRPPVSAGYEVRPVSERQPAGPGRARAVRPPPGAPRAPARCVRRRAHGRPRRRRARGAFSLPREELQATLSLLNLVNFGGGCYTVYAEVNEETNHVRVDKELYGDVFRKAPKLTPLEAARSGSRSSTSARRSQPTYTPLERVRRKLEETFGQFELAPRRDEGRERRGGLVKTLSDGADKRRLVEIEYLKEGEEEPSTRLVEPYTIERELPFWRVHTWDRTVDGPRTYRLDRMRSARLTSERFEPARASTRTTWPSRPSRGSGTRPPIARWKLERGAAQLTDRSALADVTFKTEEWLLSEVLADRGETVVVEPTSMRRAVADRAQALGAELGLSARRKRTAGRA